MLHVDFIRTVFHCNDAGAAAPGWSKPMQLPATINLNKDTELRLWVACSGTIVIMKLTSAEMWFIIVCFFVFCYLTPHRIAFAAVSAADHPAREEIQFVPESNHAKNKTLKKTFITFPFSVSSICFHVLPPFYVVTRPSQYESKVQNLKKRKIMVNVSVDGVRVLLKKRKRKVSMEAWIIF